MRLNLKYLGLFIGLVCFGFLGKFFYENFATLPPIELSPTAVLTFFATILIFTFSQGLSGLNFKALLGNRPPTLTLEECILITYRTGIAKYLPGNVFHLVGKVVIGVNKGLSANKLVKITIVESALVIVSAFSLAIPGIFFSGYDAAWMIEKISYKKLLILACIGLLVCIGIVLAKRAKFKEVFAALVSLFQPIKYAQIMIIFFADFFLFGYCMLLLQGLVVPEFDGIDLWTYTWGISLAWVAGFLVPGAPGGLGVREMVLFSLFGQKLGAGPASAIFILLRLSTISSDVFAFFLGELFIRLKPRLRLLFRES